ncbi:putative Acyltransferase [Vibrio nigripulchritudo SFn27]|uniref:Putative Acyltransferase n=1 Tax=Vibrio nigripulchritudo TaxID=28173 RepID=U4KHX2_9VIBR|nr:putative Acyltransferase [Vibrio nigripulchritudo BLFn1]CCN90864.1 putative Acyltransferase [Vibrio nigripulchritudo SFn27]CCN96204.1 putative Acyltransferase [Vibrio nigripulchritudo ENn2]CCO41247.1 putative Acyltransferase [Vibrio nigripulchritudo SFn135]CCO54585.1 putative Acyltransferase [Vibrio nigripulchritudo Wn13]CCO59929.1 putative Acyltransferase [Vibrio nigripulchritudo]
MHAHLRVISYFISRILYRIRVTGKQHIPQSGAALLIANHVSYIDALILMGLANRPVRFVMDKSLSELPILKHLFRHAGVIPICSPKQCEKTYNQAFVEVDNALKQGQLVCIFPEGRITKNGSINEFRPGIEQILSTNPVPVVPIALKGLWGSFFSHKGGHAFTHLPKRFWSKLEIKIGNIVDGATTDRISLQKHVQQLAEQ